ncbi:MAG: tRNA lysidine(34) synthetase TilS [Bacteroidales bacterium]|nr:tRNA lysidine(34) synthetase TilS [Bacteroidales bacterium]MBO6221462.1 tRNA lysidine(34) synthetase TilS [Bacteroidales bacterium]
MRDRFGICLDGLLPGKEGAVLLAVSGGIDSMVMADLFLEVRRGYDIALAHCNFHLRGEESDGDEAFVRDWAESHGVRFIKSDFDTLEYSRSHGVSVEMAARELRYGWFASLCEKEGFRAVAVAHNANDNAETLILNLLRGTGLKGICGMREISPLRGSSAPVIRPLLGFSREEIREYALAKGLKWREDSTNADSAYKRNLIRNEVFPLFAKVNPSFLDTLNSDMRRFSQAQEIADDYFSGLTPSVIGEVPTADHFPGQGAKRWEAGEASPTTGVTSVNVDKLKEIRHWEYVLYRILEPYGFNEAVIGDLTELIKSGKTFSGRQFHSPTHIAITSRNGISILSDTGSADAVSMIEVPGPGAYSVGGAQFLVKMAKVESLKQPEGTTVANLGFPFTVRRWKAGDWMRPLGMNGRRKKLSDMFNDLKFTASQKERALVIAGEGSHVLALVGYRVDESVSLTDVDLERKSGEHKLTITLCPGPLPIE